ncbi:MAG: MBL fold metallo-hydrolase [Bacteroidales bacterium]|nr:MBL fold metallo-hydrolase [Bacteroidales bacterium]
MNTIDLKEFGKTFREDYDHPTVLFQDAGHKIFWLGVPEATAFRTNTYLIVNNDEAMLVDSGGAAHFEFVRNRVAQILPPERVVAQVLSHQDPDVAASFPLWVDINPSMKVIAASRTLTLLNYYRDFFYETVNASDHPEYRFTSGKMVRFIPAPFLPAPGAIATFDVVSKFLFSGDIWAALDMEWKLILNDFSGHKLNLNLFHLDYMSSRKAARGFIERIKEIEIDAILPQHGSIIPGEFVPEAFDYLNQLNCGTDIIYAEIK